MQEMIFQAIVASGSLTTIILAWLVLRSFAQDRAHDRMSMRLLRIEEKLHLTTSEKEIWSDERDNSDGRTARFLNLQRRRVAR